jgi:serine-type D-Ala-D-Ala carboxypeptidase (penicillin-binding protein 5/6)
MLDRPTQRGTRSAAGAAVAATLAAVLGVGLGVGFGVFGVLGVGAAAPALAAPAAAASPAAPGTVEPSAAIPGAVEPSAAQPSAARSTAAARPSAPAIGGSQLSGHGVIVNYPSRSVPRLPKVSASAFVIADAGTGQVLAAKDPHGRYRPASTLKMLTAVSLIPVLNPNATTVATKLATSTVPNVVGLVAGQSYKVSALFTALLTISANDAAIALTQATGSYSKGMALIIAEARHLQADDTVAVDPNGLDAPGQHTSAYDLALIARQALQMPAFLKYDQTVTALFRIRKHKSVGLYNQNTLLTGYPGALGGKIGWTSAAGATYVGMARRHGVTLIVTLLHCPALTEITSAEKLLNWGLTVDGKVTPVGTLVSPLQSRATGTAARASGAAGAAEAIGTAAGAPTATPDRRAAARSQTVASPSVLAAAGFSCVAVIAAGLGLAYTRRQRPRGPEPSDPGSSA